MRSLRVLAGAAFAALLLPGPGTAVAQPAAPARALALTDAIAAALAGHASLQVARAQAQGADAAARQQQGTFDPLWTVEAGRDRTRQPLAAADQASLAASGVSLLRHQTDGHRAEAALGRVFGNGLQARLAVAHGATQDDALAAVGRPRQATGVVSFQLRMPLLRDGGATARAPLAAAERDAAAARADLEQAASLTVLQAAAAYWELAARLQRQAIAEAGERRGEGLLEEMRKLVAADELPRAELQLAEASLSERRAARIAAQQAVLEARQGLGRMLGLGLPAVEALGVPDEPFPLPAGEPDIVGRAAGLGARALAERADARALQQRQQAARLRLDAARNQLLPRLDVVLGAARHSLAEGAAPWNVRAGLRDAAPAGASVGIRYERSLGNHAAEGLVGQQAAQVDALDFQARELGRQIEGSVLTAAWAVQRTALQLREADRAVATYATSVANEQTKRRLGMATLIDVLNIEDRYHAALLVAAQARAAHAIAIAQWRHETATLIDRDGDRFQAPVRRLLAPND